MEKNIRLLIEYFNSIKNKELNKSLRKGTTGIGYTFESLIGKEEDSSYLPDFNGIEIKTKLGYSKAPLTLFTLTPKLDKESAIKYILNSFGYPDKDNDKTFKGDVYCNTNNIIALKYILKVSIDKQNSKLKLIILDRCFNVINDTIYWNLADIKNRLKTKLSYLAIVKGYPYNRNGITYYKYTDIKIYKLRDFEWFLKLLSEDKIKITFNISMYKTEERKGFIKDRGTAFKIYLDYIDNLFYRIY